MELLFLVLLGFAAKSSWDHVRTTRKASEGARMKDVAKSFRGGKVPKHKLKAASRRHDIGWWAGEIGHGFPVARQGWHAGWLGHRAESEAHRARVEEAKTRHAEAQAAALADLPDHKARRAAAQKRRDEILAALKGKPEEAKGSRKAVQQGADEVAAKRAEREQKTAIPPLPSETVDRKPVPEPGPFAPTRRIDGKPETEADKRFFALRESGYEGPIGQDGNAASDEMADASRSPQPIPPSAGVFSDRYRCPYCRDTRKNPDESPCPHCTAEGRIAREFPIDDAVIAADHGFPDEDEHATTPGPPCGNCGRPLSEHRVADDPRAPDGRDFACPRPAHPDEDVLHGIREEELGEPAPQPTGGDTVTATDTTFTSVINNSRAAVAASDQDSATIRGRKEAAYQAADDMAAAGCDPAAISAQMDLADSLAKAEQALNEAGEHAQNTASTVERYHGGMQAAHDDAPGAVAAREFHGGN